MGSFAVNSTHSSILIDPKRQNQSLPQANGWKIIQDVAQASFRELAISIAFVGITSFFIATPAGVSFLLISALAIVAINSVVRSLGGACAYYLEKNPHSNTTEAKLCKASLNVCNYIAPLSFSVLDSTTRDVVIHEGGHALAASLLFKDANPEISIKPFDGGVTRTSISGLTKVGQFFGESRARLIFAGAGAAAAVVMNAIHIGVAHKIRNSYPNLSRYLLVTAIVSLAGHILYALSSFIAQNKTMPGHDFVSLWMGGIHPVVSIIAMVALPILVKVGLCVYDRTRAATT